uniref:Putative U6 snRNA-associated Sm-like protein LSm4 n=1 Tax=Talaromyces marneffei PM1 TaxID=1077442 RepID=A0A093UWW9_TALMA
MAGRKRKADVTRGSNSQNVVSDDSSKQIAALPTAKSATARSGRSKADGSGSSNTTNTSEATSQEEFASAQGPKSPRVKRRKISQGSEVPPSTRFSARLKSRAETPVLEMPPKLSPQSSTEPAEVSNNLIKETILEQNEETSYAAEQISIGASSDQISRLTPKSSDAEATIKPIEEPAQMTTRGRKRKLAGSTTDTSTNVAKKLKVEDSAANSFTNVSEAPKVEESSTDNSTNDAKMPKVEEETAELTTTALPTELASTIHNVRETEAANQSVNESAQTNHTEDVGTGSGQTGTASGSGTRGRGKGGRGKGKGKGKGKRTGNNGKKTEGAPAGGGKGRGGGRGGGKGGRRADDDSEVDNERPGPPNPYAQKLTDRQKELKQNFKRLAATQKLILNELAGRTQQTLARDKKAHLGTTEFDEVQVALELALQKRLDSLENEHRLCIEHANRLLEAETQIIQDRYEANAINIQDELLYAARSEYILLVEGEQHADDDEHTEFTRGYNSRFAGENSGAASYERGKHGWDDFLQRAKLNEISQEESVVDSLQLLLQASGEALASEDGLPSSAGIAASNALFALADAASTAQPVSSRPSLPLPSQSTSDQQRLPSFMLPQAAPPTLPPSRGFPDYYTMGPRMHQLPPPPRIGLDEYSTRDDPLSRLGLNQHRNSSMQYHPFPPPAPSQAPARTTAPPPYYYPNSHTHPYQSGPAPPSQPSSSTARRPY